MSDNARTKPKRSIAEIDAGLDDGSLVLDVCWRGDRPVSVAVVKASSDRLPAWPLREPEVPAC